MADVKSKITVTLSDDDLKEAVADWLNQNLATALTFWDAKNVTVSATMQSVGHGMSECQAPVVKVVASNG